MGNRALLAVLALSIACGGKEQRFLVDGVDALCGAAADCAGTYDAQVCVDALRSGLDGCAFDAGAAADCEAALEDGATCRAIEPFALSALEVPEPCAAAYTCGARGWTDPLALGLPTEPGP